MSRARTAERTAAGAFVLASFAGVGVVVAYVVNASNQWLGALYALLLLAVGTGLIVWANGLLDDGQHAQEREPLVGATGDVAAVETRPIERGGAFERRTLLRRSLWVAGGAAGAALAVPVASLGPRPGKSLLRTAWADGAVVVTPDGSPVSAAAVPEDGLLTVFPEGHTGDGDDQVVVVRVRPELLRLETAREGWAPGGIIGYSKVCTHAGCPVGLYQAESHRLLCPCHQSAFDVLDAAKPLSGPAAWPLPQLPLRVRNDGLLVASGELSAPVGPGWWR